MRMIRILAALAMLACGLPIAAFAQNLALAQSAAEAPASGDSHQLLVAAIDPRTAETAQNSDLYLIHADGSGIVNLTDSEFESENHAVWSADGSQIYFSRNSMGRYSGYADAQSSTSFYVMDVSPEGENLGERLLFHVSEVLGRPMRVEEWALSPDEQQIAFQTPADPGLSPEPLAIYVVRTDGTALTGVIPPGFTLSTTGSVLWSPDSAAIAFQNALCEGGSCTWPYYTISSQGGFAPGLIGGEADLMAAWHAGEMVAFSEPPEVVVQVAGESEALFTTRGSMPALSPDDASVVYSVYDTGAAASMLMVADVESGDMRMLTEPFDGDIWQPLWSPDQALIAFVVRPGGSFDVALYVVNVESSALLKLLEASMWNLNGFAWRPLPAAG